MNFPADFAARLIAWQAAHGRHGLPWQDTRDPYRVWLSEVMLQQTQVATVLPYYARFLQQFPTVRDLAAASQEAVLAHWAGLGYYSRARNLHKAAQMVVQQWGGVFPSSAQELAQLPGVGMSTAAAIAAFCFGQRAAIFDANVQRVLARVSGFAEDLTRARARDTLWAQACTLLPTQDLQRTMPAYTQGLMDLGATVCTARKPQCEACPFARDCVARQTGQQLQLPLRSKNLKRAAVALYAVWVTDAQARIALQRNPQQGLWAGMLSLPLTDAETYTALCALPQARVLPVTQHTLTHRDVSLHAVRLPVAAMPAAAQAALLDAVQWHTPAQALAQGLPRPLHKLLGSVPD